MNTKVRVIIDHNYRSRIKRCHRDETYMAKPNKSRLDDLKKWALQSGYPLENQIQNALETVSWTTGKTITRNFAFEAADEQGDSKIRSVDFVATFSIPTRTIKVHSWQQDPSETVDVHFIIDGKASTDGTFWFVPSSANIQPSLPVLIPILKEDPTFKRPVEFYRREFESISHVLGNWKIAEAGKKLGESEGRDIVFSSCVQVTQAFLSLVSKDIPLIGTPTGENQYYYRKMHVYIPFVVTNAELIGMKPMVSPEMVNAATEEDEFCEQLDRVLVRQPDLFHLRKTLASTAAKAKATNKQKFGWITSDFERTPIGFLTVSDLTATIQQILTTIVSKCGS